MSTTPLFSLQHQLPGDNETEFSVEEVARQLGLPEGMIMSRIEAGDIPSRPVLGPRGIEYRLQLSDLGTAVPLLSKEPGQTGETNPPLFADGDAFMDGDDLDEPITLNTIGQNISHAPAAHSRHVITGSRVEFIETESDESISPAAELARMQLDPREFAAGLLDRWERTLEQRISAEFRLRYDVELTQRQSQVKQLQLELEAIRAEHAAVLADKERRFAERERALAERECQIAEKQKEIAETQRGWRGIFRRR